MGGLGSGRKPRPTALVRLHGNPGKKRLNEHELQFEEGVAEPPEWLTDGARREWFRIAPALIRQKVLTIADLAAFCSYVEMFAQVEVATEHLKRDGFTVPSKEGGPRSNPWARLRTQGLDQLRHWAAVFGLDPPSRSKIVAPGIDNKSRLAQWRKKYGK